MNLFLKASRFTCNVWAIGLLAITSYGCSKEPEFAGASLGQYVNAEDTEVRAHWKISKVLDGKNVDYCYYSPTQTIKPFDKYVLFVKKDTHRVSSIICKKEFDTSSEARRMLHEVAKELERSKGRKFVVLDLSVLHGENAPIVAKMNLEDKHYELIAEKGNLSLLYTYKDKK